MYKIILGTTLVVLALNLSSGPTVTLNSKQFDELLDLAINTFVKPCKIEQANYKPAGKYTFESYNTDFKTCVKLAIENNANILSTDSINYCSYHTGPISHRLHFFESRTIYLASCFKNLQNELDN